MEIDQRVALVTGSATGIGRASALALARRGACAVVVADVDEVGGTETARLVGDGGSEGLFQRVDVADTEALVGLFAVIEDRFGGLDIVHNNAGIVSGIPDWPDTSLTRICKVVATNLVSVMAGTRLAVDALSRRGGGAVVNTASIAGLTGLPTDPVYAATKAAVINFTQSCAALAESDGIRVSAVVPGMVDTGFLAQTGDGTRPADWLEPILSMIQLIEPSEVADAVVSLIEDEQSGGQILQIENQFLT